MHSSPLQFSMTQGIRNRMVTSEVDIAEAIKNVAIIIKGCDKKITEIENRYKDVLLADPGQEIGLKKAGALEQIKEELKGLRESREFLMAHLAKTKNRSAISITNFSVSDNGKILAGVKDAGGKYANARVVIDNIEARSNSSCMVGIFDGVPINDFFK